MRTAMVGFSNVPVDALLYGLGDFNGHGNCDLSAFLRGFSVTAPFAGIFEDFSDVLHLTGPLGKSKAANLLAGTIKKPVFTYDAGAGRTQSIDDYSLGQLP